MGDEDTWWYVCKLCCRAFSGEAESKAHKQKVHHGIRGTHVMILGQVEDLSPNVRLMPCRVKLIPAGPTVQVAAQEKCPLVADVESCVSNENGDAVSNNSETREDTALESEEVPQGKMVEVTRLISYGRDRTRKTGLMRVKPRLNMESSSPSPEAPSLFCETAPESPDKDPNDNDTTDTIHCKLCSRSFFTLARLKKHVLLSHVPDPTHTTSHSLDVKEETVLESAELPTDLKLETQDGINVHPEIDLPSETENAAISDPGLNICNDMLEMKGEHDEKQPTKTNAQTSEFTLSTDAEPGIKRRLRPRQAKQVVRELTSEDIDSESQDDWNLEEDTSTSEGEKRGKTMPPILLECLAEDTRVTDRHICILCFKLFPRVQNLEHHIRNSHHEHLGNLARKKNCECVICFKAAFLQTSAGGADRSNKALGFWECNLCQQSVHESRIKVHVRSDHPDYTLPKLDPEAMSQCEWSLDNLKLINNKCRTKSLEETTGTNSEQNGPDVSSRTHECGICDKKYASKSVMLSHRRDVHGSIRRRTCPTCQKMYASSAGLRSHIKLCHVEVGVKDLHLCPKCGRAFKTNDSLKYHDLIQHSKAERKFACDLCPKAFFASRSLKLHQTKHLTVKTKMCPICGLMFKSNLHLRLHHKSMHTDIRPYKCKLCDASFKQSLGLKRHAAKHIEDKTFPCSFCPKLFKTKVQLDHHANRTHLKKRKQSHICQLCSEPKEFPGIVSLSNHQLQVHDYQSLGKFECKYCQKKFARQFNLDAHELTHTNERKLACDTCGKTFKLSTHLHQHRFTHLPYEELPNVCDVCGKRFGLLSQLRAHKQRIHQQTIEVKRRGPAVLAKSQIVKDVDARNDNDNVDEN